MKTQVPGCWQPVATQNGAFQGHTGKVTAGTLQDLMSNALISAGAGGGAGGAGAGGAGAGAGAAAARKAAPTMEREANKLYYIRASNAQQ